MWSQRRVRRGGASYIGAGLDVAISRTRRILTASDRLYVDHAAPTPVLPQARAAVSEAMELWANPSSPHGDGRKARAAGGAARRGGAGAREGRRGGGRAAGAAEAGA